MEMIRDYRCTCQSEYESTLGFTSSLFGRLIYTRYFFNKAIKDGHKYTLSPLDLLELKRAIDLPIPLIFNHIPQRESWL
jgi:hypothetical protein